MNNFTYENKTKVYFGKGVVGEQLFSALGGYGDTVMLAYGCGLAVLHLVLYRHIYEESIPRFARFARNVWGVQAVDDRQAALNGINALSAFICELGLPTTLHELGIPEDTDLEAVAASTNISVGCCKRLTHGELYEILKECR